MPPPITDERGETFALVAELLDAVDTPSTAVSMPDPVLITTGPGGVYLVAICWRGPMCWHAMHYVMGHHAESVAGPLPDIIALVAIWIDAIEWEASC
jgi:hypothetical protein